MIMKRIIIFSLLSSLVCCEPSKKQVLLEKHVLIAKDTKGNPIEGLEVWATYDSSNYAPKFKTDIKGVARIDVKNYSDIHSLSIYYKGLKYSVSRYNLDWPVEVMVDKNTITKK